MKKDERIKELKAEIVQYQKLYARAIDVVDLQAKRIDRIEERLKEKVSTMTQFLTAMQKK